MRQNLSVATYNIRHAEGIDGQVDLNRIAEVIQNLDVDIIGLQEVDDGWKRSGRVNQASYLGRKLNMHSVFGPAIKRGRAQFGNAILSRYPIRSWDAILMPSDRETRGILRAIIDFGGVSVQFLTTHLGLSKVERIKHLNEILLPALVSPGPLILCGDFNCTPDQPEITLLKQVLNDTCPADNNYTFSSNNLREKIDYVMCSFDIQTVEASVYNSLASDHCPLKVILNF
ncbi:MAG: endonuclease/exonuclease/phosphatase family protein [Chitinophagales bacterium]